MKILLREFYERDTVQVAQDLLGKILVVGDKQAKITEVEAYLDNSIDPAAHKKPLFFGPAGVAYVFLNYGVHWCFNVIAEPEGKAGCVLIRGVEGISGPGRVTKYFGITGADNGLDLTLGKRIYILDNPEKMSFITTPRIGISKAIDFPLRFVSSSVKT